MKAHERAPCTTARLLNPAHAHQDSTASSCLCNTCSRSVYMSFATGVSQQGSGCHGLGCRCVILLWRHTIRNAALSFGYVGASLQHCPAREQCLLNAAATFQLHPSSLPPACFFATARCSTAHHAERQIWHIILSNTAQQLLQLEAGRVAWM